MARRPTRRLTLGAEFILAAQTFVITILVLPPAIGAAPSATHINRSYPGGVATASINWSQSGCAQASAGTLPFLNGSTGIGGFSIRDKAWACTRSSQQSTNISAQLVDRIPVSLPSGPHAINVTWSLRVNATTRAYQVSGQCFKHSGRCWDIARSHLYADAVIKDLTNGSVVSSGWVPSSINGFAELDNFFGYVRGTHFRGTFHSGVNLSAVFVASHRYVVITTVYGDLDVIVGSSPSAILVSSLDLSSPFGARLAWIKVW